MFILELCLNLQTFMCVSCVSNVIWTEVRERGRGGAQERGREVAQINVSTQSSITTTSSSSRSNSRSRSSSSRPDLHHLPDFLCQRRKKPPSQRRHNPVSGKSFLRLHNTHKFIKRWQQACVSCAVGKLLPVLLHPCFKACWGIGDWAEGGGFPPITEQFTEKYLKYDAWVKETGAVTESISDYYCSWCTV